MIYKKEALEYFLKKNLENKLNGSANSVFVQGILEQSIEQINTIQSQRKEIERLKDITKMSYTTLKRMELIFDDWRELNEADEKIIIMETIREIEKMFGGD